MTLRGRFTLANRTVFLFRLPDEFGIPAVKTATALFARQIRCHTAYRQSVRANKIAFSFNKAKFSVQISSWYARLVPFGKSVHSYGFCIVQLAHGGFQQAAACIFSAMFF